MATVNKDFKIKQGLVVEGATGTINGENILTEGAGDSYITNLIGGSADTANTPNTVVKRDGNGDFAAGAVTVNRVNIGEAGFIEDDGGDLVIDLSANGDDFTVNADDIRLNSVDDILLDSGLTGDISLTSNGGNILLQGPNIYAGENIGFTDAERVATRGYVDNEAYNAQTNAEGYTDAQLTNYTTTANLDTTVGGYGYIKNADLTGYATESYVDTAEADAVSSANSYTDDRETAITSAYQTYADQAETDANAYTDTRETAITTAYQNYANQAETDAVATANAYTDDAVADLVNGAPELLDTLNELAAALQDNPDVITDLQGIAAGKQDELTAGSNIDITGATISVTGLDTDDVAEGTNLYFQDYRAVDAVAANLGTGIVHSSEGAGNVFHIDETFLNTQITNGARDAVSVPFGGTPLTYDSETGVFGITLAADNSIGLDGSNGLKVNRDTVDSWYDAAGAAQTAEDNAIAHADALTTDDISEGLTNQYFSDVRAKTSAAALLTGATLDNITITGDENGLTITAENGVAGSNTDDLAEGEENLYFTDERAIDAVSAADIYPNAVIINNLTKQVANQVTVATAGIATGISWAKESYRSAEFVVKVAYGDHTEVSKVLMTLDVNDNIAITEYGNVTTNGSASTISADISGTDARLRVTTVNNNSTVTVLGTLIA